MSGRGGGGRGGGFGGRGRGRGGAPPLAVARDDDGTVLNVTTLAGPPPLFPEIELPDHPEIAGKDKMLLVRRMDLLYRSKQSPFFIEPAKEQTGGVDDGLADSAAKRQRTARAPLSTIMTLVPDYFPEELYSTKEARSSRTQSAKGQIAIWKAQGKEDVAGIERLEQLAKMESSAGEKEAAKAKEGGAAEDDAPPEEEELHDTDEEEDMEFDDYYQGEHFDDDDGYGDLDDGGDDGAIY